MAKFRKFGEKHWSMQTKDFFKNFVSRAYGEYIANSSDEYKFRVACLFSFHMAEYIFENEWQELGYKDKGRDSRIAFIKYLSGETDYLGNNFGIVQAVCNSTKHLKSGYYDLEEARFPVSAGSTSNSPVTVPGFIVRSDSGGLVDVISLPHWELDVDGKKLDASWALDQVYNYWVEKLNDQNQ